METESGASRADDPTIDLSLKMRVTFLFAQILCSCERGVEHNSPLVALEGTIQILCENSLLGKHIRQLAVTVDPVHGNI